MKRANDGLHSIHYVWPITGQVNEEVIERKRQLLLHCFEDVLGKHSREGYY